MSDSWNTTTLAGHTVEVFTPKSPRGGAALLYLPAEGKRASQNAALTAALNRFQLPAVSPAVAGTWWLDIVEPAFDAALPALRLLADHVVPLIESQFGVSPPAIGLLGREVGGQGVLQLAYRQPRQFPAVAAIDPAIDFHERYGSGTTLDDLFATREVARQHTALLRMQGVGWPRRQLLLADRENAWFDGADRLDMKLRSMGIPLTSDFTSSTGGDGDAFFAKHVAAAVEFLLTDRSLPIASR